MTVHRILGYNNVRSEGLDFRHRYHTLVRLSMLILDMISREGLSSKIVACLRDYVQTEKNSHLGPLDN